MDDYWITGWDKHSKEILAAMTAGDQVLVTVVSRAAELYAFPWALLTLGESGRQLGARKSILLRYKWPRRVALGGCPPEAPKDPDVRGRPEPKCAKGRSCRASTPSATAL